MCSAALCDSRSVGGRLGPKSRWAALGRWWYCSDGSRGPTGKSVVRRSTGSPSCSGRAGRVREDIRFDEARGEVETETPEVDDGEATGGLQANPGETPVTTAAFSELEGDSAM